MSVITNIKRNTEQREVSEFDGLWINVGVHMESAEKGGDSTFVRLPRGVAISDLKPKKVYDNMDPAYAGQVNLMNQLISIIQTQASALAEGESCSINLQAQLYRRQEEADVAPTPKANNDLAAALFG